MFFVELLLAGRGGREAESSGIALNLVEVAFWSCGFPGAEEDISAALSSLSEKQ